MKRLFTILLLSVASLMMSAQTYTVTINGIVTNEDTGEPIVQAQVWIYTDSIGDFTYWNMLYTGGNGTFTDTMIVPDGVSGILYIATSNCDGSVVTSTHEFSEDSTQINVSFAVCGDPNGEDCQAEFYAYPTGNSWLTMQFMDISQGGPTSWSWDFGDGMTSNEQNPLHSYDAIGEYMVTLTIENDSTDCISTVEQPIFAGDTLGYPDSCMAWFYGYPDSADYLIIYFQDMSIGQDGYPPESWYWEFGDGNTSTDQNPTHMYAEEGTYTVCLTISDDSTCTSISCQVIEVIDWDAYCEAQFYFYPTLDSLPAGDGLTIQFMDMSIGDPTDWFWIFGDNTTSTEQNPVHTYAQEGNYEVCLSISNTEDSCYSTYCQEIYVFNDSTEDCMGYFTYNIGGLTADFAGYIDNDQQGAEFTWEFGDGTTGSGQQVSHTYSEEGLYYVVMTAEDSAAGCFTTYAELLQVGEIPMEIAGYVFLDDSLMADDANVYLIAYDTLEGEVMAVDETTIDENGYYMFTDVNVVDYLYYVQAELTEASAYYGQYVPTYYVNALNWTEAWPVFPVPSGYLYTINMLESQNYDSGSGSINGWVTNMDGRSEMVDVEILLLDEEGHPLTYRMTGEEGAFGFAELAYGTYVVHTEIVGVQTTPVTVVISEENPAAELDIVITNGEAILGIGEESAYLSNMGNIYPNPSGEKASLTVQSKKDGTLSVSIISQTGILIRHEDQRMTAGSQSISLDVEGLPKGIYFVRFTSPDGYYQVRKLVKL